MKRVNFGSNDQQRRGQAIGTGILGSAMLFLLLTGSNSLANPDLLLPREDHLPFRTFHCIGKVLNNPSERTIQVSFTNLPESGITAYFYPFSDAEPVEVREVRAQKISGYTGSILTFHSGTVQSWLTISNTRCSQSALAKTWPFPVIDSRAEPCWTGTFHPSKLPDVSYRNDIKVFCTKNEFFE